MFEEGDAAFARQEPFHQPQQKCFGWLAEMPEGKTEPRNFNARFLEVRIAVMADGDASLRVPRILLAAGDADPAFVWSMRGVVVFGGVQGDRMSAGAFVLSELGLKRCAHVRAMMRHEFLRIERRDDGLLVPVRNSVRQICGSL